MAKPYIFEMPLIEGIVEKRKSQFTMLVNYEGDAYSCHCPTTGRIGNLDLAGRPCLMSKSKDEKRKTPFTVEAVSLNRPEDADKEWIGINQNAANRYVEHFLVNGGFKDMVGEWMKKAVDPRFPFTTDKLHYDLGIIEEIISNAVNRGELKPDTPVNAIELAILTEYYGALTVWCMSDGDIDTIKLLKDYSAMQLKQSLENYIN